MKDSNLNQLIASLTTAMATGTPVITVGTAEFETEDLVDYLTRLRETLRSSLEAINLGFECESDVYGVAHNSITDLACDIECYLDIK